MSNEYKEWLKEQTFESLANDNLRMKLELQTAKEEIIRLQSNDYFYVELDKKNETLTQQNKQLEEKMIELMAELLVFYDFCGSAEFKCPKEDKIKITCQDCCIKYHKQQALNQGGANE